MEYLLFGIRAYQYLAERLAFLPRKADGPSFVLGQVHYEPFPDDELGQRFLTDVRGRDVMVLGGMTPETTAEFIDLAMGAVDKGARSLTMVIPYFGCQTNERERVVGDIVTAKNRARLLSAIPRAPMGNEIVLMDLHADAVRVAFEGVPLPAHLYCQDIHLEAMRRVVLEREFAAPSVPIKVLSPDGGRVSWVQRFAAELGLDMVSIDKRRVDGSTTKIWNIMGDVKGCYLLAFDDMARTCGTIIDGVSACVSAGAVGAAFFFTHGVLPGAALERLMDCGVIDRAFCTDSHHRAVDLLPIADGFLEVNSVAPVIRDYFRGR